MDIITFRATVDRMLRNQPPQVQELARKNIEIVLNLLDQETMSKEAIANVIFHARNQLLG